MKVRYIAPGLPTAWDAKMGPAIGLSNDMHFLQHEPWLEIRGSTMQECKNDGVIPWLRCGARPELLECERLGLPVILGPNVVFADSNQPWLNDVELQSDVVYRLLMNDLDNMGKAMSLAKHPEVFRQVPYFMRPELYEEPFFYEHEWDVYFHIKGNVNKYLLVSFPNLTATHHGWYCFRELKYKAQHSAVCVHACVYDNYGLAAHEISMLGCPMVYDRFGFKPGTIGEGMGVEVSNVDTGDVKELEDAVRRAMAMDRRKVWEASREYQSIENCLERYRRAILD